MVTSAQMPLSEAAREIGIPYPTVYAAWAKGKVPYERRHGLIWVRLDDVRVAFTKYKPRGVAQPSPKTA